MYHAVMIVSAQSRTKGEALGEGMGWGMANFTVKLTNREDGNTSHYGLAVPVGNGFIAFYEAALRGENIRNLPEGLIDVVLLMIVDIDRDGSYPTPLAHFEAVLATHGLRRVEN